MALALDCPHCGVAKVETVNHVWYIQGFLLFARYGSKPVIGCAPCVRGQTFQSLAFSSVLGWWCFPWGLGTPFVIIQNIVAAAGTADDTDLRSLLSARGMDIDDLELDADGRSAGDVRLVNAVLHTLHQMVWADGSADDREIEAGSNVVSAMLGEDLVAVADVAAVLSNQAPPSSGKLDALGPDAQLILMKAACAVAVADDVIEDSEIEQLRELGRRMGLAVDIVEKFVHVLQAVDDAADDEMRMIAAATLGVEPDSNASDVRSAYQKLILEATQEADAEVRSQRLEQVQGAYQIMLGA